MRWMMAAVCVATLACVDRAAADDKTSGFLPMVHKGADGESKYYLFVPHKLDEKNPAPLILFLHGAGERGDDGEVQVKQGIGSAIRFKNTEKNFPFYVILPQCKKGSNWMAESPDGKRAMAILDEVMKSRNIDPNRVYLTGLSMGGFGTWSLANAYPESWAAIAPICGGGKTEWASKIKDIPCWCFHGDQDKAVPVQRSRDMIDALKKAGGSPRYSEFPFVGHNSWDPAYTTPELYSWFLSHRRK